MIKKKVFKYKNPTATTLYSILKIKNDNKQENALKYVYECGYQGGVQDEINLA